ncbi:hypothetical protein L195_g052592, partial [Trifolium pratense]
MLKVDLEVKSVEDLTGISDIYNEVDSMDFNLLKHSNLLRSSHSRYQLSDLMLVLRRWPHGSTEPMVLNVEGSAISNPGADCCRDLLRSNDGSKILRFYDSIG